MVPTAFYFVHIITNKKFGGTFMFAMLKAMMNKPAIYEKGTIELWTDEHISRGMLEAHLHPTWDAATRNHAAVRKIVKWISSVAPAKEYPYLLDLGCGPGIYAEEFYKTGYHVSGMDVSERSINYARNLAKEKNLPIIYYCQNFITMDFKEQYDVATLIYYDFCTLPTEDRVKTLKNIYEALKSGGLLIVEVTTPHHFYDQKEHKSWSYAEKGFYCANLICALNRFIGMMNTAQY
jgi:SAM-dependent methyltransferase